MSLWDSIKNFFKHFTFGSKKTKPEVPVQEQPPVVVPPVVSPEIPSEGTLPFRLIGKDKIQGIDVYHYDGIKSFQEIAEEQDFIIFKVSEGASHEDTKYKEWIPKARAAGLIVGYYHFFRTNVDPIKQAQSFLSKVKPFLKEGDLCVVCDYETEDDKADGFDIFEVALFLETVESSLNWIPWVYSGHILKQAGKEYTVPKEMARYPLWIAHYTNKSAPTVPAPWAKETLWQYTETAMLKGMSNPKGTDHNRFNGTGKDFDALRYRK